jgi:hypothetical protein
LSSFGRILSATVRSSDGCRARYTTLLAPTEKSSSIT